MMRLALTAAAVLSLLATPVASHNTLIEEGKVASAEQLATNEVAKAFGERIYRHDRAAARVSAELNAFLDLSAHPEVRGYLTEELAGGNIAVVFYAEIDGRRYEFARAATDGLDVFSAALHENVGDNPLSESLNRLATAREVALAQGVRDGVALCMTDAANFVILSPNSNDIVRVYILSAASQPGRYPLGGHFRYDVDAEGKVVGGRLFSQRCFDVPVIDPSISNPPDKYQFAHILDPQPHEIHHFVARYMNLPMEIHAGDVVWTLDYRKPTAGS